MKQKRMNVKKSFKKFIKLCITIYALLIFTSISSLQKAVRTKVFADIVPVEVTSCFVNDVTNTNCYTALTAGTPTYQLTQGSHIDAQFQSTAFTSITSASLSYTHNGRLSGSWAIALKDVRDGTTICQVDPAPEVNTLTTSLLNCNSLTPTHLNNGVWLYIVNQDDGPAQSITLSDVFLSINGTLSTVSISITTDGTVAFGTNQLSSTVDTTASGLNDIETVQVDTGPADLDIKSTDFTEGSNTWSLGSAAGSDVVKFEFSKDSTNWSTFLVPDILYTFDTNVAQAATRDLTLRLSMPTSTLSYNEFSSTVTIVASAP